MAAIPAYNPVIPFLGSLGPPLAFGAMVRVQGSMPLHGQRYAVNLQIGPNTNPRDDIALHLSVRPHEGVVIRNHIQRSVWGMEERHGICPIMPGQGFDILILAEQQGFKIAINGRHFCEFAHRLPLHMISHVAIDGDVIVTLVNREGGTGDVGFGVPPAVMPTAPAAFGAPTAFGGSYGGIPPPYLPQPMIPPNQYNPTVPPAVYPVPIQPYPSQPYSVPVQPSPIPVQSYSTQPLGYNPTQMVYSDSYPVQSVGYNTPNPGYYAQPQKKSSNKILKYGLGIGGVGLGAYALSQAFGGSGSSGSDSD